MNSNYTSTESSALAVGMLQNYTGDSLQSTVWLPNKEARRKVSRKFADSLSPQNAAYVEGCLSLARFREEVTVARDLQSLHCSPVPRPHRQMRTKL